MKTAYSTFGRKRDFVQAGPNANVTFTDDEGKEHFTTLAKAAPCRVLNGRPVPQPQGTRWPQNPEPKSLDAVAKKAHGELQPTWGAKAVYVNGVLVVS